MPSADLRDTLDLLATELALSQLPVIILTGKKDRETMQRCADLDVKYAAKGSSVWPRVRQAIGEVLSCG